MHRRNPRVSELTRQGLIVFFLRRNVVLGIFLCTVTLTAIASTTLVPQYRADAAFLITGFELSNARNLPGAPNTAGQGLHSQMLVTNEIRILKSTDVAASALATLREDWDRSAFYSSKVNLPGPVQALRRAPGKIVSGITGLFSSDDDTTAAQPDAKLTTRDPMIGQVLHLVQLRPTRDTGVISVSVEHSNPAFALATVQAYLDAYIGHRRRLGQAEGAVEFYREEADRHWQEWTALNEAIQTLKAELGVVAPTQERAALVAQLNTTNTELENLETTRDELRSTLKRLDALPSSRVGAFQLPEGLSDPVLSQLRARVGQLEATRADRLRNFTAQSSMVRSLDEEIALVHRRAAELSRGLIQQGIARYQTRIDILEANLLDLRERALELERAETEIGRLTTQAQMAQEKVRAYERKYSETTTRESLSEATLPNIGIVASASVGGSPVFPNRPMLVGAAAVLGLFMGMLVAFVQEMLDDSLKLPDQISEEFGIPVLGTFELELPATAGADGPAVPMALGAGA